VNVKITITTEWDKAGGESLKDFEHRRTKFMDHVTRMQLNGSLPRSEIKWEVATKRIIEPGIFVDGPQGLVKVDGGDRLL
jgi:hypothetical protein